MKKQLTILFLFVTIISFSQKLKVLEGDFKNLKGVKEYNLVFDYSNLKVAGYRTEEGFLKEIVNVKEKNELGLGMRFKNSWFSNRANIYEPSFIKSFNEYFKKGEVKISKDLNNPEYTIKVQITNMYIGYYVDVYIKETKMDAIITVYKSNSPSDFLLLSEVNGIIGKYGGNKKLFPDIETPLKGFEYYSGERIEQVYWLFGKYFAKRLRMGTK